MGYETKLIIGVPSLEMDEYAMEDLIIEDGKAYRPYKKDSNGELIKTGRKEVYFQVMAMVDLCKCGYSSHISKINWKNTRDDIVWYWYTEDGNTQIKEDRYGDASEPVDINIVIEALKKDVQDDDYRRFKWALALLESMKDDKEGIKILFYGH